MRSIAALRGSQALITRRWHYLQTAGVCHRQRGGRLHTPDNGWQHQHISPLRCISTSSAFLSSPDAFHGMALPKEKETVQPSHTKIQEAEVVKSEEEKSRNRELIKEVTRAEMSVHSIVSSNDKKDDDSDALKDKEAKVMGPYERRLQQLNEAQHRHQTIDRQQSLEYAQSCMNMGDLQYQLGDMEQSQQLYMDILKHLLSCSVDNKAGFIRKQIMIAQSMHALGAIHARCGEYDEASRWYEESLEHKHKSSNANDSHGDSDSDSSSSNTSMSYRYELGKTYNGLAALEVMKGGDVQWEKAMSLFQEAERNYLYGHEQERTKQQGEQDDDENDVLKVTNASSTYISEAAIQKMTPRHVESLINVRSNMGELLRQRGQYEAAVEMFQLALDMARMAMEHEHEKASTKSEIDAMTIPIDEPSPEEQGNTIVDLLVKIADNLISAEKFDDAAEAYEQALSSHVFFRRRSEGTNTNQQPSNQATTALPVTTTTTTKIKFDLAASTTMEAAIRNNLAHALAQIGQDKLSLEHYEASLATKRRIGGDFHMEVAHTLMAMGALLGGPLRDFTKALNCFKEALFIYRSNLEELGGAYESSDGDSENLNAFFGDEDAEEIDRHIQNALKNISLIEAAMLKDRDGASRRRRR